MPAPTNWVAEMGRIHSPAFSKSVNNSKYVAIEQKNPNEWSLTGWTVNFSYK